jgi:hypothetical protein
VCGQVQDPAALPPRREPTGQDPGIDPVRAGAQCLVGVLLHLVTININTTANCNVLQSNNEFMQ